MFDWWKWKKSTSLGKEEGILHLPVMANNVLPGYQDQRIRYVLYRIRLHIMYALHTNVKPTPGLYVR